MWLSVNVKYLFIINFISSATHYKLRPRDQAFSDSLRSSVGTALRQDSRRRGFDSKPNTYDLQSSQVFLVEALKYKTLTLKNFSTSIPVRSISRNFSM